MTNMLDGPADCTLACDEGHLTAHKIMLCAHSKYLADILSKFPNAEHPIIILTELNITDIKILVHYMYTGELVITNDGSPSSLLRAAQILKIDSLTDFDDEDDQNNNNPQTNNSQKPQQSNRSHQNLNLNSNNNNNNNYHHLDDDDMDEDEPSPTPSPSPPPPSSHHHHHRNNSNNNNHHQPMQLPQQLAPPLPPQLIKSIQASTTASSMRNNRSNNQQHNRQQQQQQHQQQQPQISNLTKDSNNKIRCHLCNIGLSDVKCLYRHVLTRHLPEKWGYKCEFCDREFSRDDHLMRHYTTKHKNMEFNREKIRETRRLNREMAKNFHDQISKIGGIEGLEDLEGIDSIIDDSRSI